MTALEYRLFEVGPETVNGLLIHPLDQATEVFSEVAEYMREAPRELMVHCCLLPLPPLPPIPEEMHGVPVAIAIVTYIGDLDGADAAIAPLAEIGRPLANTIERKPYLETNATLDVLAPPGRRMHSRGGYLSELSGPVLEAAVGHFGDLPAPTGPGPSSAIIFWCMGGAVFDTDEDAMAFSREGANWMWESLGQWDPAEKDAEFIAWVDGVLAGFEPYSRTNGYINLTVDQGAEWRRGIYGSPGKLRRLEELKAIWDPRNLLRHNKNIEPAGSTGS